MWRGATKLDMGARRRRGRQPNPVALTAMNCERCGKDREPGYRHSSDRPKAACRGGQMALRWVASAALEASRGFRRLKGYREMSKLVAALRALDNKIKHANVREVG